MSQCPSHQVPWKTIPAGISKKTNKPYNAFQRCPVQGCEEKPDGKGAGPVSVTHPQQGEILAELKKISALLETMVTKLKV